MQSWSVDVVQACLNRIKDHDKTVNAFITVIHDGLPPFTKKNPGGGDMRA